MKNFVSSKGASIELRPVSQFKIDTLRASKHETPAPTYEMSVAGGGKQVIPLDQIIAANQGRLEEWNQYLEKRAKEEEEHSKKFLFLIIWEGVQITVPDMDSEWQKVNDFLGIEVPENLVERKLFYVYNELLGTPQDLGDLIAEIFAVSQIDEEAVKQLRDSFRLAMERKPNQPSPKNNGAMASKPNVQRARSDSLLAPAAK